MKKRSLALAMAFAMVLTSVPAGSISAYGEEADFVFEDAQDGEAFFGEETPEAESAEGEGEPAVDAEFLADPEAALQEEAAEEFISGEVQPASADADGLEVTSVEFVKKDPTAYPPDVRWPLGIKNTEVTIRYADGSEESFRDWEDNDAGRSLTGMDGRLRLELDENGAGRSISDLLIPTGTYTLSVKYGGVVMDTCEVSCGIADQIAEIPTEGAGAKAYFYDDASVYGVFLFHPTEETQGSYVVTEENRDNPTNIRFVYVYKVVDDSLTGRKTLSYETTSDYGLDAIDFQADTEYYLLLQGDDDVPMSGSYMLTKEDDPADPVEPGVLQENQEVLLKEGAESVFRFTPSQSGYYRIYSKGGAFITDAYTGEEIAGALEKDKAYYVEFYTAGEQTVKIAPAKTAELRAGETATVSGEDEIRDFVFTPGKSGRYVIQAREETGYSPSLFIPELMDEPQWGDSGKALTLYRNLEAGKEYRIRIDQRLGVSYQVSVAEQKSETPELTVTAQPGVRYAALKNWYSGSELFHAELTYADGNKTSEILGETDMYGNWLEAERGEERDNGSTVTVPYEIRVRYKDSEGNPQTAVTKTEEVVFTKGTEGIPVLKAGVQTGGKHRKGEKIFYQFTAEEEGTYRYFFNQTETYIYFLNSDTGETIDWGGSIGSIECKAGDSFCILVNPTDAVSFDNYLLSIEKAKNVSGLTLKTAASYVVPVQYLGLPGMTAEISYTDGTTRLISAEDETDGWGNAITREYKRLPGNQAEVTLRCVSFEVSFTAAYAKAENLTALSLDTETAFAVKENGRKTVYSVFQPKETGSYAFRTNQEDAPAILVYNSAYEYYKDAGKAPATLNAGETYMIMVTSYESGKELTIQPYRTDKTGCEIGDHTWATEKTVDKEPTCTEAGSKSLHCSLCGAVKEESQEAIPALGHAWDAGAVTKAATCTEAGIKTYTCTRCKGTRTEAIPATGHQWGAWTTTSAATVFAAEVQTRTCLSCGQQETQSVGSKLKAAMKVSASSIPLKKKQSVTNFKVTGLAAGDSVASWKSSNKKIVKVSGKSNGTCKITAQNKTGSAKITITLKSGLKKTVTVKVQSGTVKTKKITGVAKSATLKRGKSLKLTPVLSPISSREKVTYKSSNKKVATVSSKGKITAKKKGTAVITVKSGKISVKCKVKVK